VYCGLCRGSGVAVGSILGVAVAWGWVGAGLGRTVWLGEGGMLSVGGAGIWGLQPEAINNAARTREIICKGV